MPSSPIAELDADQHRATNPNLKERKMKRAIQGIKLWLLFSPLGRTSTFILSVVVSGVLCGGFVNETTIDGVLRWELFYTSRCFYFLLGYAVLIFIYHAVFFKEENKIEKFSDHNFCVAYMKSQLLPAVAKSVYCILKVPSVAA
jgi:hypothetical protein